MFKAQHTGNDYMIHCLVAPKHYWDYVQNSVKGFSEMKVITPFDEYFGYYWETHFRDTEHIAFATSIDAESSLPFVKWKFFKKDCSKLYNKIRRQEQKEMRETIKRIKKEGR